MPRFLPFRAPASGPYAYWIVVAMLAVAALAGGASREDSMAQVVVRTLLPLLLALLALVARPVEWRSLRLPLLFMGLVVLVAAIMLVPLPPSVWTALAGRDLIEPAAQVAGMPQPWRPWAMVPPLGHNALYALVPPGTVLVAMAFLSPGERARLAAPLGIVIVASAVLGVAQVSGGSGSPLRWYAITNRGEGVGFFANRNHQALFLAMGFPVLAFLAFAGERRKDDLRVWLAGFAALLLAVAVLTTGSRAGLVAGAIGVLGSAALHFGRLRGAFAGLPPRWRLLSGIGAVAVLALVAVALLTSSRALAIVRLFGLDPTDDLRARALPTMVAILRDTFPAGTGFGGFEPVFRAAEPFELLSLAYLNEAHNDYLQLAIEGGAAGLALLAAFLVWWAVTTFRLLRRGRRGQLGPSTALARTGALMVLLVVLASAADYPMRTPLMMVTLVLACVWMTLPTERTAPER